MSLFHLVFQVTDPEQTVGSATGPQHAEQSYSFACQDDKGGKSHNGKRQHQLSLANSELACEIRLIKMIG
jgi:hypothetical protein